MTDAPDATSREAPGRAAQGSTPTWRDTRAEWRTEWRVGLACLVCAGLSWSIWPSVSSLLVQPLQTAFGWSRGQIALAANMQLLSAFMAPVVGQLADRFGARRLLIAGFALMAAGYGAMSLMSGSLPLYYAIYGFLSVVGVPTTAVTISRVISGAFVQSRGLALAASRFGVAVAATVLPPLIYLAIARTGWQSAYLVLSGLAVLVALPIVWIFIHDPSTAAGRRSGLRSGPGWRGMLADPRILVLCFAAGLSYAPISGLLSQLQPLLVGKGIEPGVAASLLGLIGLSALFGAVTTGALVDRVWAPAIACVFTLAPAVGCMVFLSGPLDPIRAALAVFLIGFGQGAEIDVVGFMIARYFGLGSYSRIYGLAILAMSVFSGAMISLMGLIYDHYAGYAPALLTCIVCFVVSAVTFLSMGRYPADPGVRTPRAEQAGR